MRALPRLPRLPKLPRGLRWLPDVALVAAVLLGMRAWQHRDAVSGEAPALSAMALDGSPVSLETYRGRPMMLHFWATWCGVCEAEQHNVVAVAKDLPVLTIASHSGGPAEVSSYMRSRSLELPVVVDRAGELARRFGVHAFPTSFVLDADGEVRHVESGYTTELGMRLRMWLASL